MTQQLEPAPDEGKGFTPEQRAEIIRRLSELIGQRSCEMCGHPNWALNPNPVSPLMLSLPNDGEISITADLTVAHPSVLLHCMHCGNLKMFSLNKIGLLETKSKESD